MEVFTALYSRELKKKVLLFPSKAKKTFSRWQLFWLLGPNFLVFWEETTPSFSPKRVGDLPFFFEAPVVSLFQISFLFFGTRWLRRTKKKITNVWPDAIRLHFIPHILHESKMASFTATVRIHTHRM